MKKIITFTLILLLGLCFITGCGKDNDDYDSDDGRQDGPKTPSVTVNPGSVIFDNNVVKIVYKKVELDSTSMDIYYEVTNKSNDDIYVQHGEIIYNGNITNTTGIGQHNFYAGKTDESVILMYVSTIKNQAGILPEEIKTVQVTFTVNRYGTTDTLFEGTALLNIVLP